MPSRTSPVEHVRLPQELRQLHVAGPAVQRRRRVQLRDDTVPQHRHLVGHGQCLVLIVGHQDGRRAGLAQHGVHIGSDRRTHGRVERGEGLVEEDDLGPDGECPGERDPLLLPARELVGVAPAVPGQPHQLEELVDPAAAIRAPGQAEGHVAPDAEMREQRALLGDVPDAAPLARHEATAGVVDQVLADEDLSVVGPFEAGHDPQQRRLAAPRGAEDRRERPGRNGQVHAAQDRLRPECLGHAGDAEVLHATPFCVCVSASARRARPGRLRPCARAGGRTSGRARSPGTAAMSTMTAA